MALQRGLCLFTAYGIFTLGKYMEVGDPNTISTICVCSLENKQIISMLSLYDVADLQMKTLDNK